MLAPAALLLASAAGSPFAETVLVPKTAALGQRLAADPRTACIVMDQKEKGGAAPNASAAALLADRAAAARAIAAEMADLEVWPDMTMKLTHPEFGPDGGWSAGFAATAIREYARFMALGRVFGGEVPSKVIDEVWHAHILDTRRYAADCERVFGQFVHHYPYFGMGATADSKYGDSALLLRTYGRTLTRYVAAFGELPPESVWGKVTVDGGEVVPDPQTACVCICEIDPSQC